MCNFCILSKTFRLYVNAQRRGDFLECERIKNLFIGIFLLLEKHNYAPLCIENIERKYFEISYEQLHEVRINSFCRYRESKVSADYQYVLHVLDEVMENINKWVKSLSLGSTVES